MKHDNLKLATLLATLFALACGSISDPAHNHQGCFWWNNSAWDIQIQQDIAHNDSRSCPLNLNPGDWATSGGKLVDNTVTYPNISNTITMTVQPFASATGGSQHICFDALAYPETEFYAWGPTYPYKWQVEAWVTWQVQASTEYPCFDVWTRAVDQPHGVLTINYYGEQW